MYLDVVEFINEKNFDKLKSTNHSPVDFEKEIIIKNVSFGYTKIKIS